MVAVIAIGGDSSDWYGDVAGGVAYVGGFAAGSPAPNVGYVFSETLGNEAKLVADAASHEAGHLFGLNHQAVWNGGSLADEYNPGRPDWAPIMGVSYDAVRSTWYNGTPDTLASVHQDDMAMIAGPENGFGYRQDDYGDTFQGAAALPLAASDLSFSGLIGQIHDRDVWAFTTDTALVNFQITGAPFGPNLDGELELWDSSGSSCRQQFFVTEFQCVSDRCLWNLLSGRPRGRRLRRRWPIHDYRHIGSRHCTGN